MRPLYIFALLVVSLFSCEVTLDKELPPHTPKLVLYSTMQPGDSLKLFLSRSYGPLERVSVNDLLVTDASVTMLVNGSPVSAVDYLAGVPYQGSFDSSGYYLGLGNAVQPGDRVTMEVSHPDFETARGETVIPVAGSVKSVELIQNAYREIYDSNDSYTQSILRITFNDPAGVKNYYRAGRGFFSFTDPNAPGQLQYGVLSIYGPALPTNDGGFESIDEYASDEGMDGEDLVVDFLCEMPNAYAPADQWVEVTPDSLWLEVEYANEDFAEYQRKLRLQRNSSGGGISLTPSEPVELYSNIEGGYGVIGGFLVKTDSLTFE